MEELRLETLEQTCFACPSQWEGKTVDGQYVYIRYRWGYLSVGIGSTLNEAIDSNFSDYKKGDGYQVLGKQLNDSLDGFLSEEDLRRHLIGVLAFPA